MKKYLFSLIIVMVSLPVFSQQHADNRVIIKGTLKGDLKGHQLIYMYTRTSNDSAKIENGHYTFTFPFTEPGMKMLYPEYIKASHMMYSPFGILVAQPGTYYVDSDIEEGMAASKLKGPEPMVLYHQYQNEESAAYKKAGSKIQEMFGEKWWQIGEKDPRYSQVQSSSDSLRSAIILPVINQLVSEHPNSYASAFVLSGSGKQYGSIEQKEALFNLLSPSMQQSEAGQEFMDYIQGLKNSAIGKTVNNFILPSPTGKEVDFNDLRGKYVLIDFWASWCSPCRQSFPHMRKVYKKYKSPKFEIYSISIDEDKDAWLQAIKEENNPWLQSLDTKNISQSGFAVTAVPSTFLINPQGKIILKEIGFDPNGGSEIEKKLVELFGGKADENPLPKKSSKPAKKSVPMIRMDVN